jgi:uncharacterized membrane protein YcaP (DUF421 family)
MWFDDWNGVARVLAVGAAAYVALVVLVRVSGKRTLSKLNAFDLVVTVALGSCLATVLLSKEVAFAEGLAAFFVLVAGQFAISWTSVRSRAVRKLVKSQPRILLWRGEPLEDAMRDERITREELESAARGRSIASLSQCGAIVLETDGSLHVVRDLDGAAALDGLGNVPRGRAT